MKNDTAIVVLNRLLRFYHNPTLNNVTAKYKRVYIVYMFDTQKYGDVYTVRRKNERMFILNTLIDLDNTIQKESSSRLLFFVRDELDSVIRRIREFDNTIGHVYYDGGASLNDIRIKMQLNRLKDIKLHFSNSEDNATTTWRRNNSSRRTMDTRKHDYSLYKAPTLNEFDRKIKYSPLPDKMCRVENLIPVKAGMIRGEEMVSEYADEFIRSASSGNKFGGRRQAISLLVGETPVSFGFIYPFLRFGVIDPNEFIASPHFTRLDYTRYVFMRRIYERKDMGIVGRGEKKLIRIYKARALADNKPEIKGIDKQLNKNIRLLRKRGIISDKVLRRIIIGSIDGPERSWASIMELFRRSFVGFDVAIVTVIIYSAINIIKYGIDDDLIYAMIEKK